MHQNIPLTLLAGLLATTFTLSAADTLPPMIGLRGDGTGVFADARPVNEWSETKNLLWKVPVPNYGNSSPIVVAGKIFVTSEPGWGSDCPTLACWDAQTGKQLWVKDLDQFADLPEAERSQAQGLRKKYYEMMWEVNRLGFQLKQETDEKKKQELIDKISAVSQGSQKGGMTFAGFPGKILETKDLKPLRDKYAFNCPTWWYSDIGMTFGSPVSDGKRIYVATAYGAMFAFDLDGNPLWQQWHKGDFDPKRWSENQSDMRYTDSPLIVDGKLVLHSQYQVRAYDPASGKVLWKTDGLRPAPGHSCGQMAALHVPEPSGKGTVGMLITYSGELLRISDGAVLKRGLTTTGFWYALTDGVDTIFAYAAKVTAENPTKDEKTPKKIVDPALFEPGLVALKVLLQADGSVQIRRLWRNTLAENFMDHGHAAVYRQGVLYGGQHSLMAIDASSGAILWQTSVHRQGYKGPVKVGGVGGGFESIGYCLGGDLLMATWCDGASVTIDTKGQKRGSATFPAVPEMLGAKRDQVVAETSSELYSLWYGWNFGRTFPFFSGRRHYIRSFDFLYCFGPAVEGVLGEDPKIAAGIRAESDPGKLTAFLSSKSAMERFEASKRLGNLKKALSQDTSDALKKLMIDDAHEEIRTAAFQALDACDPKGDAGWQILVQEMLAAYPRSPPQYSASEASTKRHRLYLLSVTLGDSGKELVASRWPSADALVRRVLLDWATRNNWKVDAIIKEGMEVALTPTKAAKTWNEQVPNNTSLLRCLPDYFLAIDAAADPAQAEILMKAFPKEWLLYPSFRKHVAVEKLLAWIEPIAMESAHPSKRTSILQAWNSLGTAAIPSMERVQSAMEKNDKDKLAAECAKEIGEAIAKMKEK